MGVHSADTGVFSGSVTAYNAPDKDTPYIPERKKDHVSAVLCS